MLRVDNISFSFGARRVLNEISFKVTDGEFIGLVGPSGSGKSVLLKVLGSVLPPQSGAVSLDEGNRVGFLFQEGALFDSMSVLENIAFPLVVERSGDETAAVSVAEAYDRAFKILAQVGLSEAYAKYPGQLSGGMRRRVGIARALVAHPQLVLLDDPTGGLDPVAASVIMDLIHQLHREYLPTVVIVSHDIRRLLPSVERVIALFEGEIICDLSPRQLLSHAPHEVIDFLRTRFDFATFDAPPVSPSGMS